MYETDDGSLAEFDIEVSLLGNNSVQSVKINTSNVRRIEVKMRRSGAVTFVEFCPKSADPTPSPTTPSPTKAPTVSSTNKPSGSSTMAPTLMPTQAPTDESQGIFSDIIGDPIRGEATGLTSFEAVPYKTALSQDGTIIAVGAIWNNGNGPYAGSVRVYRYGDSFGWRQLGSDIDGEKAGDRSGRSVSLSGDGQVLAIGADGNDSGAASNGHVRVYKFDDEAWMWNKLGSDIDGRDDRDRSGFSVSLSHDGSRVAVGTPQDMNGLGVGYVSVYEYDGSKWEKLGSDIDGEVKGDLFGNSVSLSSLGDTVAVGAPLNESTGGYRSGRVRVYAFDGSEWSQLGDDIGGKSTLDWSGFSVSLSGDGTIVCVGDVNNLEDSAFGNVRVYKYDGKSWIQLGGPMEGGGLRTTSVAMSADGRMVAVGVYEGKFRVFKFDGLNWVRVSVICPELLNEFSSLNVSLSPDGSKVAIGGYPTGQVAVYKLIVPPLPQLSQIGSTINGEKKGDWFGYSLSLMNRGGIAVAIGAPLNDSSGDNAGHVRVYEFDGLDWIKRGTDIIGKAPGDQSGRSVSLSRNGYVVAVGAERNSDAGPQSGHVRVYRYDDAIGDWAPYLQDIVGEWEGDSLGKSVSIAAYGSVVAAGANMNDEFGKGAGYAAVYRPHESRWEMQGSFIFGKEKGGHFGRSISLSSAGDVIAVGIPFSAATAYRAGQVRVYTFNNGESWEQMGAPIYGKSENDWAGFTISLSSAGDIVAFGGLNDESSSADGYVRVFQYDGSANWNQLGDVIRGDNNRIWSVSLSGEGDIVSVGSYGGQFRVYTYDGLGWNQVGFFSDGRVREDHTVSVSRDGRTIAVGAYLAGQVEIFKLTIPAWRRTFRATGYEEGDNLGYFVSLSSDGRAVAIGAATILSTRRHFIQVYGRSSSSGHWLQLGDDLFDAYISSKILGESVAMSGDGRTVAYRSTIYGRVIIRRFDAPAWNWGDSIRKHPFDNIREFGASVSLSEDGSILAISDTIEEAVYMYQYNGTAWISLGKRIKGGETFGKSVSLSADGYTVAVVSARSVDTYKFNGTSWDTSGNRVFFTNEDPSPLLSVSLSADGTTVAVGEYGLWFEGKVRVYEYNGEDWMQLGSTINGGARAHGSDEFGRSVSLSADGTTLACGAPDKTYYFANDEEWKSDSPGYVHVYKYDDGDWNRQTVDIDGEKKFDLFGTSVSLNARGTSVAVGAPGFFRDGVGYGKVYDLR